MLDKIKPQFFVSDKINNNISECHINKSANSSINFFLDILLNCIEKTTQKTTQKKLTNTQTKIIKKLNDNNYKVLINQDTGKLLNK